MTRESRDAALRAVAARQLGLISRRQSLALGLTRHALAHRVANGSLIIVAPRVYRIGGAPETWPQQLMAATLSWGEPATISHAAASVLHRLPRFESRRVELIVPKQRRGNGPGEVHRAHLPDVDRTKIGPINVTTLARTIIDVAGTAAADAVEQAFDEVLRRGVSLARIEWRLQEVGGSGRAGSALIRQLIDERREFGIPRSVFETPVLRSLLDGGLPPPVLQYPVKHLGRLIGLVDFAYPVQRIAIEVDGFKDHSGLPAFERDRERGNQLTLLGWRVIRITKRAFDRDPSASIDEVRRALVGAGFVKMPRSEPRVDTRRAP